MTRPGGRGVAALALAAAVGISGGAVTAFVAQDEGPHEAVEGPDPLDLGVPLANLPCDEDQVVILVGEGDTANQLSFSVADWKHLGVRYLETAESCQTVYPRVRGEVPTYVAYLPPYPTAAEACEERMQDSHRGDVVTVWRDDIEDSVVCACELDRTSLPEIGENVEKTAVSGMWTYTYQRMLDRIGLIDITEVTQGTFDKATATGTRRIQTSIPVDPTGDVDLTIWTEVRDRACPRFDYSS